MMRETETETGHDDDTCSGCERSQALAGDLDHRGRCPTCAGAHRCWHGHRTDECLWCVEALR